MGGRCLVALALFCFRCGMAIDCSTQGLENKDGADATEVNANDGMALAGACCQANEGTCGKTMQAEDFSCPTGKYIDYSKLTTAGTTSDACCKDRPATLAPSTEPSETPAPTAPTAAPTPIPTASPTAED